ncbi:hypothetical protein C8R48DRAFT_388702 [Suillus tomentosus]|nr:hypothetical protein C8R48DRAFT_388702 [Suillus tomentosus]
MLWWQQIWPTKKLHQNFSRNEIKVPLCSCDAGLLHRNARYARKSTPKRSISEPHHTPKTRSSRPFLTGNRLVRRNYHEKGPMRM